VREMPGMGRTHIICLKDCLGLLDVRINKMIKVGTKENWEHWMFKGKCILNGAAKDRSQNLVVEWLLDVYACIVAQPLRNALMNTGFAWL
jgi:hypothetical protein